MQIFQEFHWHFKYFWGFVCDQESGAWWSLAVGRSERTCESLRAGVDPRQPLGCAKIWYLQDAAVGVDENIITLRNRKDIHENSVRPFPRSNSPVMMALRYC